MKRTMHVVITDKERFAKGDLDYCLSLKERPALVSSWVNVHSIEIDFSSVDLPGITADAVKEVDDKIIEVNAAYAVALERLKQSRSELLSITHQTEK